MNLFIIRWKKWLWSWQMFLPYSHSSCLILFLRVMVILTVTKLDWQLLEKTAPTQCVAETSHAWKVRRDGYDKGYLKMSNKLYKWLGGGRDSFIFAAHILSLDHMPPIIWGCMSMDIWDLSWQIYLFNCLIKQDFLKCGDLAAMEYHHIWKQCDLETHWSLWCGVAGHSVYGNDVSLLICVCLTVWGFKMFLFM